MGIVLSVGGCSEASSPGSEVYGPFQFPGSTPARYPGVFYNLNNDGGNQGRQLGVQLYGVFVCLAYSTVASLLIFKIVDITMGLRAPDDVEVVPEGVSAEDAARKHSAQEGGAQGITTHRRGNRAATS